MAFKFNPFTNRLDYVDTSGGGGFVGSPIYFQAYKTSTQVVAASDPNQVIIFDDPIVNVGGGYDPATGRFTANADGFYGFSSVVYFNQLLDVTDPLNVILGYTGNVQSLRLIQQGIDAAVGDNAIILGTAWQMPMSAGDVVEMQPFVGGTGNYTIFGVPLSPGSFNSTSTFSGFRIA